MEKNLPMAFNLPSIPNSNCQTGESLPAMVEPPLAPLPATVAPVALPDSPSPVDSSPIEASPVNPSPIDASPVDIAETHLRLAQRVALPDDVPQLQPEDAAPADGPVRFNAVTFNAVAVITPDEAASLSLTSAQRTAIMKLTSGCTRVDAAAAAGVTRLTLYRWLKHDPAFQCAYNAWQKDLITTAQGQLLAATRDAMATVLNAIRKGDAGLAWKLLESQGLTTAAKAGPTDIHELERREALEKRKREIEERKERHAVKMDDMFTLDGM
jgi:hypothetical protein